MPSRLIQLNGMSVNASGLVEFHEDIQPASPVIRLEAMLVVEEVMSPLALDGARLRFAPFCVKAFLCSQSYERGTAS